MKQNSEPGTRDAELETRNSELILVCFALPEEAAPFRRRTTDHPEIEILITGVGRRNAERSLLGMLAANTPRLIFTCGYAGGLDPALTTGQVVFAGDAPSDVQNRLRAAGACEGRFHCAERILAAAADKRALRAASGADAVEMESGVIANVCRERGIPCLTVRVILDEAEADLPLDFNLMMTQDQRMDGARLASAILKSPGRIPALLRLRKQARFAGEELARALEKALLASGQSR